MTKNFERTNTGGMEGHAKLAVEARNAAETALIRFERLGFLARDCRELAEPIAEIKAALNTLVWKIVGYQAADHERH
jgi:hypothetical protein